MVHVDFCVDAWGMQYIGKSFCVKRTISMCNSTVFIQGHFGQTMYFVKEWSVSIHIFVCRLLSVTGSALQIPYFMAMKILKQVAIKTIDDRRVK